MAVERIGRHNPRGVLGLFLIASALCHGGLLVIWMSLLVAPDGERATPRPARAKAKTPMRVRLVVEDSPARARLDEQPKDALKEQPKKPKPKKEKPKPPEETPATYIALERPKIEETPEQANLSSRFARKVERQMVRRGRPGGARAAQPQAARPGELDSQVMKNLPVQPSPATPRRTERKAQEPERAKTERSSTPLQAERARPVAPELLVKPSAQRAAEDGPTNPAVPAEAQRPSVSPRALFPSAQNAATSEVGDGGMINFLKLPDGERTLLSRKRNRYWSFFDRLQRQVKREWSPNRVWRQHDPYGNVYGVKDRYTTLQVTLRANGSLQKLHVARSSGLEFYDDEAVRAMNAAGPFPNPPEGLKDEDGLIHFRFGFYFEITSGELRFIRPELPNLPGMN